jgi:hypothetical protein
MSKKSFDSDGNRIIELAEDYKTHEYSTERLLKHDELSVNLVVGKVEHKIYADYLDDSKTIQPLLMLPKKRKLDDQEKELDGLEVTKELKPFHFPWFYLLKTPSFIFSFNHEIDHTWDEVNIHKTIRNESDETVFVGHVIKIPPHFESAVGSITYFLHGKKYVIPIQHRHKNLENHFNETPHYLRLYPDAWMDIHIKINKFCGSDFYWKPEDKCVEQFIDLMRHRIRNDDAVYRDSSSIPRGDYNIRHNH